MTKKMILKMTMAVMTIRMRIEKMMKRMTMLVQESTSNLLLANICFSNLLIAFLVKVAIQPNPLIAKPCYIRL